LGSSRSQIKIRLFAFRRIAATFGRYLFFFSLMESKRIALGAVAALLIAGLYFAWLWQPERQVRRHQAALIKTCENRNWSDLNALVAETYSDRWEHDKGFVVGGSREVFRQFLFLTIQQEIIECSAGGGQGYVASRLRISGSGSPIAQQVMAKVNTLADPFAFTWIKSGWQPWRWRMTRFDHPKLEISSGFDF
jgi:hypothetical protein